MLILHLSQNQSRSKHSVNTGYVLRGCSSVIVDYKNENGFPSSWAHYQQIHKNHKTNILKKLAELLIDLTTSKW